MLQYHPPCHAYYTRTNRNLVCNCEHAHNSFLPLDSLLIESCRFVGGCSEMNNGRPLKQVNTSDMIISCFYNHNLLTKKGT